MSNQKKGKINQDELIKAENERIKR